ncbi:MAG: helix-turn-helix transcriptional regulator [Actinomycetota bacterium]
METYEFTLVLRGPEFTAEIIDTLAEAGLDDATFGVIDGVPYADVDREANSLVSGIVDAIHQVEGTGLGYRVVGIEPDDLLTAAEIAERTGRTRESVRLLVSGERGPGNFPPPISRLRTRNRLWRWSEVAAWFAMLENDEKAYENARRAAVVHGSLNAALDLRNARGILDDPELKLVEELVYG